MRLALVFYGEESRRPPLYSTSDRAANRLLRGLQADGLTAIIERFDTDWYCRFASVHGTIATGTGDSRALAIARAALTARRHLDSAPTPSDARCTRCTTNPGRAP